MEKFAEWLAATSPETLEKLAEAEQDRLIEKLFPLMEKQAEYIVHLIKLAAEEAVKEEDRTEVPIQEEGKVVQEELLPPKKPITGTKDNIDVDPVTKSDPGIQVNDIIAAVQEAIEKGQLDKITTFVKAVASHYPEATDDIIKIVKVELQDAGMKQLISLEDVGKVAEGLNMIVEGGQAE